MVIELAEEQTGILRKYAPTHAVPHNFMMLFTEFDYYKFVREVGIGFATIGQSALAGHFKFA